jgi:carbonic anhydrase
MLQVYHLALNPTVLDAWEQGRRLSVNGMVYDIESGLLERVVTGVDSRAAAREQLGGFDPA